MNLYTYNLVATGYDEEIHSLTDTLVNKFKNALSNNANELIELIHRNSFDFISKNGEIIKVIDDKYIPIGKYKNIDIYISVFDHALVYFEKDTNINQIYPLIISDDSLHLMFRDIDLFQNIMHIVGLNGILEKSVEYKSEQLKDLKKFIDND